MKIFLTGPPGSGKSTVLMKTIELLKKKGMKVGGMITPEIRERGRRIGFGVKDVYSGKEGILASIDQKTGPKVGKYRVNLEDFERIALPALDSALKGCDVVCIDEVGRMEWFSKNFRNKVYEIFASGKKVVAILHREFVSKFKDYGEVIKVVPENREKLPEDIVNKLDGSAQS